MCYAHYGLTPPMTHRLDGIEQMWPPITVMAPVI